MKIQNFKISTKKFKTNLLLQRKQFSITIYHPGYASIPKKELQKELARVYKIQDSSVIFLFGFKTSFGGGKSTGFGFIYNNIKAARQYEPRYRLIRNELLEINRSSAKQRKEQKNKGKKNRLKKKKTQTKIENQS
nr:40S ribosomal protein S24 [Cryptomonas sp.]